MNMIIKIVSCFLQYLDTIQIAVTYKEALIPRNRFL